MKAIYLRELRAYFTTIIGYLFLAAMLLIVGMYTYVLNFVQKYPTFEATLYYATFAYILVIPILTMRTFSEERHTRTADLLYSLPIRISGIVMGKYFAFLTILAIPCVLLCIFPLILSTFGTVELLTSFASILAFFLLGAALGAIGMFLSSLTSNQIASAILIFVVSFFLYMMQDILPYLPSSAYASFIAFIVLALVLAVIIYILTRSGIFAAGFAIAAEVGLSIAYFTNSTLFENRFSAFMESFAVFSRFDRFVSGLFDLGAIGYFLSVIFLFLFFSVLSLEKRRWN